jgi:hypothetical protein
MEYNNSQLNQVTSDLKKVLIPAVSEQFSSCWNVVFPLASYVFFLSELSTKQLTHMSPNAVNRVQ